MVDTDEAELPFFRQDDTLNALADLAEKKHIVIYCGAGVSIDRTGVNWRQLVKEVFDQARTGRVSKADEIAALEHLIADVDDPRHAASILIESLKMPEHDEDTFLASKLHHVLYEKVFWSRGYMLRNLVQFAIAAASAGRVVEIITTNYDAFIEFEFARQYKDLADVDEDTRSGLPEVKRFMPKGRPKIVESAGKSAGEGRIELRYPHGRVDSRGSSDGPLVLSEASYALTRKATEKLLLDAFSGEEKGVLIVGASLTDEPLITSLALRKDVGQARYALLTVPGAVEKLFTDGRPVSAKAKTVASTLRLRGQHIGVNILNPMSHYQSSQFLEELRVSISAQDKTGSRDYYRDPANGISYSARLESWARSWEARDQTKDPDYATEQLKETLDKYVRLELKPKASKGEKFRAELWVRKNPRTDNRVLTLWANSTGPFLDTTVYRTESIIRTSANASVQAFTEGRPILRGIESLKFPAHASRWQTFLSMPIFVSVPIEIGAIQESAYIPAGVLTVTSDHGQAGSTNKKQTVLQESLDVTIYEQLKYHLIGAGLRILSVTDEVIELASEEDASN